MKDFNSRPSARGDHSDEKGDAERSDFNSRPSARGDKSFLQSGESGTISIHAPPRGATCHDLCFRQYEQDFNSRPSARGDVSDTAQEAGTTVISIHAPPRGATRLRRGLPKRRTDFNSRPSARGDGKYDAHPESAWISIHAPPRGATRRPKSSITAHLNFNSRPSARGDDKNGNAQEPHGYFNSRPSARGDANRPRNTARRRYFNSRPSARGDGSAGVCRKRHGISIHAPPRGATTARSASATPTEFQFTPLREGRPRKPARMPSPPYFNSRPSARGDHERSAGCVPSRHISIHAPPRGATSRRACRRRTHRHFNSRPSARGDPAVLRVVFLPFVFQFTPLREGRQGGESVTASIVLFQFTPLREGRRCRSCGCRWSRHFNSRPSARGDGKRYAISANLLFNPYKSAWLNNSATQFVEIILVIFHRIIV